MKGCGQDEKAADESLAGTEQRFKCIKKKKKLDIRTGDNMSQIAATINKMACATTS